MTQPAALVRPRLRGVSHVAATALAALGTVVLLARAEDATHRWAAVAYGGAMTAMFAVSAAYHRGRWSPPARRRMKAADHTTIFGFIVASYTPLAVLVLDPRGRLVFLGSLGALAAFGVVVKLRTLDRAGGPADVIYGLATWWGLLVIGPAVRILRPTDLALILVGLLLYAVAAGFLGGRWLDLRPATFGYHEFAHAVALLGTACHFTVYYHTGF